MISCIIILSMTLCKRMREECLVHVLTQKLYDLCLITNHGWSQSQREHNFALTNMEQALERRRDQRKSRCGFCMLNHSFDLYMQQGHVTTHTHTHTRTTCPHAFRHRCMHRCVNWRYPTQEVYKSDCTALVTWCGSHNLIIINCLSYLAPEWQPIAILVVVHELM